MPRLLYPIQIYIFIHVGFSWCVLSRLTISTPFGVEARCRQFQAVCELGPYSK